MMNSRINPNFYISQIFDLTEECGLSDPYSIYNKCNDYFGSYNFWPKMKICWIQEVQMTVETNKIQ
jgi:hypothetical protein